MLAAPEGAPALTLHPGESTVISQTMAVPALPPKLDFVLVMDTTGTMDGEVANAKAGGPTTFVPAVRADSADPSFAVVSFEDYPYSTYGNMPAGDQPYRLGTDLTANDTTWSTAVKALTIRNGGAAPEAQVPALCALATGQSLAWPGGAAAAGQGISFRPGAAHVVAVVSDAAFHNDKNESDAYSFTAPTYAEAVSALASEHVRVIAADSTGAGIGADMAAIAGDTGGATTAVNANGTGLWTGNGGPGSPGILGALKAQRYSVTTTSSCDPLQVSLSQGSWADVAGGTNLPHTETITVPAAIAPAQLPADHVVDCVLTYAWGDVIIGSKHVAVEVAFPPPAGGVPSNAFAIRRAHATSRGAAVLVLEVPGPGRVGVVATASAPRAP